MSKRRVLLLNAPTDFASSVTPLLGRDGFEVDRLRASSDALALICSVPFHLVVVGIPLNDPPLKTCLEQIRSAGSICRSSRVLVVTGSEASGRTAVGFGADGFSLWPCPPAEVIVRVADLLAVAPRHATRLLTRLEVQVGGRAKRLLCQTENLSKTGMLLRTGEPFARDTRLDLAFSVPGDQESISAQVRVVRVTDGGREKVHGVGVRFEDFAPGHQERLEAFLDRELGNG